LTSADVAELAQDFELRQFRRANGIPALSGYIADLLLSVLTPPKIIMACAEQREADAIGFVIGYRAWPFVAS
jgi:hypothetical protein